MSSRHFVWPSLFMASFALASALAACGESRGGDSSLFPSEDAGAEGGDEAGNLVGVDANGGADAASDGAVVSNYACPGCPAFPPLGTSECAPAVLGPPSLAYPTD